MRQSFEEVGVACGMKFKEVGMACVPVSLTKGGVACFN